MEDKTMIREEGFMDHAEMLEVILHMGEIEISIPNEGIGWLHIGKIRTSVEKYWGICRGEQAIADEVYLNISEKCVAEIEYILTNQNKCPIDLIEVIYDYDSLYQKDKIYYVEGAWKENHSLRVTSKGQLSISIGQYDIPIADTLESLPSYFYKDFNVINNDDAVFYTEENRVELCQSHYQLVVDSKYQLAQLIKTMRELTGFRSKSKLILALSIYDLVIGDSDEAIGVARYTYYDNFGAVRNIRVDLVWKGLDNSDTGLPTSKMVEVANNLKNKNTKQLKHIFNGFSLGFDDFLDDNDYE